MITVMPTAADIEQTIIDLIYDMADENSLPKDPKVLLSTRVGELPFDSLDMLALAMRLEDGIGRVVEVEELDPSISVSELASRLGAPVE